MKREGFGRERLRPSARTSGSKYHAPLCVRDKGAQVSSLRWFAGPFLALLLAIFSGSVLSPIPAGLCCIAARQQLVGTLEWVRTWAWS